jgi:hypothetical protein
VLCQSSGAGMYRGGISITWSVGLRLSKTSRSMDTRRQSRSLHCQQREPSLGMSYASD